MTRIVKGFTLHEALIATCARPSLLPHLFRALHQFLYRKGVQSSDRTGFALYDFATLLRQLVQGV